MGIFAKDLLKRGLGRSIAVISGVKLTIFCRQKGPVSGLKD